MNKEKLKVAFFGDDFSRQGKGTALVIQKLVEDFTLRSLEVEVTLLRPEGVCKSAACSRVRHVIIRRRYSTLLSYLWFFISHRERYDAIIFNRVVYPGFFLLRAKRRFLYLHDASCSEVYVDRTTGVNLFFDSFLRFFGQLMLSGVIAVSNDAKKWIERRFHIPSRKVFAIYNGVERDFVPLAGSVKSAVRASLVEKYGISGPYLLVVARFDPHKNVERAVEAFILLKKRYSIPHSLVLVGGCHTPGYSESVMGKVGTPGVADRIRVVEYVADEDMPALYACADMLLYPSLIEGFGLPIVEAFACGTPVVTSNVSSMPEIAGGAAMLVDPLDAGLIAEGVLSVLNDPQRRAEMVEKGLVRATDFSWSKTADTMMDLIRA